MCFTKIGVLFVSSMSGLASPFSSVAYCRLF